MTMATGKRPRACVVGLAAVALAATVLTGPAAAAGDTAATASGHLATQRAIDGAVASGVPGVTAESRGAGGVWKSAAGVGNLETGTPRGKDDRFRIGSITNTFVATVLLQMSAEKKISLEDTVEQHLPGLVTGNGNDGSRITVRQLLNHSSGLFDYLADPEYGGTYAWGDAFLQHRYDTLPHEQRVRVALAHPPLSEPGAGLMFSHTNDILAALIVEKVAGRPYEEEVRARIIRPLGLRATSHPGDSALMPRPSSRGYAKVFPAQPDRIDDVTELNGSQSWGDGDMISSAADLNVFFGALMRGKLLPQQQLREMKTTLADPYFPGASYGLGIERLTLSCGTTIWYHDGGTFGWISLSAFTEDGRHQFTFNFNGSWGAEAILPLLNAEYCATPASAR